MSASVVAVLAAASLSNAELPDANTLTTPCRPISVTARSMERHMPWPKPHELLDTCTFTPASHARLT